MFFVFFVSERVNKQLNQAAKKDESRETEEENNEKEKDPKSNTHWNC